MNMTIGCMGQTGPDGEDAFLADSLAPQIRWLTPPPGSVIDSTVTVSAEATDDQGIWRLVFYIAGFEFQGSLIDSASGVYHYTWHAELFPDGPYPMMARAWDDARNMATTPVIQVEVNHQGGN